MNLKSEISSELWDAISSSYKAEIYKSAILDAIHFLSDAIREKADLDIDGEALIDKAFGGKTPLLKINKYQIQTEQDEHRGFFLSLKGLYAGIRNPRSHQKYEDSAQTANAIILFIDFLLKQLDLATPVFTIDKWIQYVLDPDFVFLDEYANLLIEEIPRTKLFDTAILLYRKTEFKHLNKIQFVLQRLLNTFDEEKSQQFVRIISEDLREVTHDQKLRNILAVLPNNLWLQIEDIPRMRVKNKVFNWIEKAKITKTSIVYDGEENLEERFNDEASLISWITHFLPCFNSDNRLFWILLKKLQKSYSDRNFVSQYFLLEFPNLVKHSGEHQYHVNMLVEVLAQSWIKSSSIQDDEAPATSYVSDFKDDLQKNFWQFPEAWRHLIVQKIEELGCPGNYQDDLENLKKNLQEVEF